MTYPLVQFVSAPDVDADVRFDFNAVGSWADAETWPGHEGFSIGVPSLEGDPDAVGVEYGFRELSFSLFIKGDKASALAAQSALAKEILRRTNWLRFQLTEHSEPVWFKTYRTAPGELDFQYVYTETAVDHWGIAVTLTADPFAYGARETLPTVTINNDPAAATNPMSVVLPTIKGDAPAPLTVRADANGAFSLYPQPLVTVAGQWSVLQSSAMNAGTDADATDTASAAYSGGSYRRVTFATVTAMYGRVSGSMSLPANGRYRMLARIARSDTNTTFNLQGQTDYRNGPIVSMNRATTSANTNGYATWIDLGEFSYPFGVAQEPVSTGEQTRASDNFILAAERTSGTGNLRIDVIVAVPVEDATTARYGFGGLWSGSSILDGDTEQVAWLDVNGKIIQFMGMTGAFPEVDPNTPGQRLYFFQKVYGYLDQGVSSQDDTDDLTGSPMAVSLSYVPRYLYLGTS